MYKIKNLISLILVLTICFSFAMPVGATEIGTSGQDASVPVTVNVKAAKFSVTVPTGLPVNVDENGTVVTATDAKIINNSIAPVKVENVQIAEQNGWELIAFETDKSSFKIDEKKIGLQINSANETTQADGSFAFDEAEWRALNTSGDANDLDEYIISYNAIVSPQSEDVTGAIAANVIFTVGWEKAIISFYIDGVEYQAEAGMTWGEWIESDYNTAEAVVNGDLVYAPSNEIYAGWICGKPDCCDDRAHLHPVLLTDQIIAGYEDYWNSEDNFI